MLAFLRILLALCALSVIVPDGRTNAAPFTYGKYYEDSAVSTCAIITICTCENDFLVCAFRFSAIPSGASVLLTTISCHIEINPGTLSNAVLKQGGRTIYLPITPAVQIGSVRIFNISAEFQFLLGPGQRPEIELYSEVDSNWYAACRVSGQRPSPI